MDTDVVTPGTSTAGGDGTGHGRWRRWLRLVLTTITAVAVAVAVLLAASWVWGPGRHTDAWASRFGDPSITLSDGLTLPTDPVPTVQWRVRATTYGLPDSTDLLAEAFGGPVRQVGKRSWATATGEVSLTPPRHSDAEAKAWDAARMTGLLQFQAPMRDTWTDQPTFPTPQEREAEVYRLYRLFGWPAEPGQAVVTTLGDGAIYRVTLHIEGTQVPDDPRLIGYSAATGLDATFGSDGRLLSLIVPLAVPEVAVPVEAISAAQAFDDLRHHREGAMWFGGRPPSLADWVRQSLSGDVSVSGSPDPVASWLLVPDRLPVPDGEGTGITVVQWLFLDAAGNGVGSVQATPPIRPLPEDG